MSHWLHPEAEFEWTEAAVFYEKQASSQIASAFLTEFERVIALFTFYEQRSMPFFYLALFFGRVWSSMRRMYYEMFGQMKKMLGQLDKWLEMAGAYAQTKKFDPNVFLGLRLAPDQFAFARQVQVTCDTAKLGASRLTGKEAPVHADNEQTLEDLRGRVQSVIAYLDGFTANDFEGIEARTVTQPRWEGQVMTGPDYFREHLLPNFFFHFTHVYAILRHNGVNVGKRDYLGEVTKRAP